MPEHNENGILSDSVFFAQLSALHSVLLRPVFPLTMPSVSFMHGPRHIWYRPPQFLRPSASIRYRAAFTRRPSRPSFAFSRYIMHLRFHFCSPRPRRGPAVKSLIRCACIRCALPFFCFRRFRLLSLFYGFAFHLLPLSPAAFFRTDLSGPHLTFGTHRFLNLMVRT